MINELPRALSDEEHKLISSFAQRIHRLYVARSLNSVVSVEDLIHCGIVGLLEARRTYKAAAGVPFLGYASQRIRGEMMDFVRRKVATVHIPQLQWDRVRAMRDAESELVGEGAQATPSALARRLGWTSKEVAEVKQLSPRLETPAPDRSDDLASSPKGPVLRSNDSPERHATDEEAARLVQECLDGLESVELRTVLIARVLHDTKLKDLAKFFDRSMERIRQMENQAKKRLKECLESKGIASDDLY